MAVTRPTSSLSSSTPIQSSPIAEVNNRRTRKRQRVGRHEKRRNTSAQTAQMSDSDVLRSTSTQNEVHVESGHNWTQQVRRKTKKTRIHESADGNDNDDDDEAPARHINNYHLKLTELEEPEIMKNNVKQTRKLIPEIQEKCKQHKKVKLESNNCRNDMSNLELFSKEDIETSIHNVNNDDNDDDDEDDAIGNVNSANGKTHTETSNHIIECDNSEVNESSCDNSSDDDSIDRDGSEQQWEGQERACEHSMSEVDERGSNISHSAVNEKTIENQLHEINPSTLKLICTVHEQLKACVTAERSLKDLLATRKEICKKVEELCENRDAARLTSCSLSHSSPFVLSTSQSVVVRLNVGGELFVVPVSTLLGKDKNTYFHLLFGLRENRCDLSESEYSLLPLGQKNYSQNINTDVDEHTSYNECMNDERQQHAAYVAVGQVRKTVNVNEHVLSNSNSNSNSNKSSNSSRNSKINVNINNAETHLSEQVHVNKFNAPLFIDDTGAIFIDRDPATFRYILSYLRGYTHLKALDEDVLNKVKVDARYFQLHGLLELLGETNKRQSIRFLPGPGVNPEGTRLRVIYGIATIGQSYMLAGRHRITFEVCRSDYVGLGVVSDACVNADQEFHRTPNCCVYYMSGVFYSNFPHHRKEENLARFENGEFVTIDLDMDKRVLEFTLKNSKKILSIGQARRLRFAVTMKLSSIVRIVPNAEYERMCKEQSSNVETASALGDELQTGEQVAQRQGGNHDPNQAYRNTENMALQSEILHSISHQRAPPQQQHEEEEELLLEQELQRTEHFDSVWDVDDETADLHSLFYDEMYDS